MANVLHPLDIGIIIAYIAGVICAGVYFSKQAAQGVDSYFLGGRRLPWYLLGISNASGMFDITGTMWTVGVLFMYGLKSVFLPWVWPTFNQIFLMIFLATWMRRSRVLTGAEWLATRFSKGPGLEASHLATVFFALVLVVGMIGYAFTGIGKFAVVFLRGSCPQHVRLDHSRHDDTIRHGRRHVRSRADRSDSVRLDDDRLDVDWPACDQQCDGRANTGRRTGRLEHHSAFGLELDLDWTNHLSQVQSQIDSPAMAFYQAFGAFFMMAVINGILKSMAGPSAGLRHATHTGLSQFARSGLHERHDHADSHAAALLHGGRHHGLGAGEFQ